MIRPALAALLVALLLLAAPLGAIGLRDEFARLMDEGVVAYESGDYEAALSSFQDAEMMKPESYEAAMNAGLAYAHLGDYEPAVQRFRKAEELAVQNPGKRSWALYNKGRFLFQTVQQDFEQLKAQKEDSKSEVGPERLLGRAVWCLDTFDEALDANPQNADARFNRAQAQHLIDELAQYLKKPPQQSGGQQEQQDSDEQSDEQQDQNSEDQQNQQQSGDSSQKKSQDQQDDGASQPQGNDKPMEGNADSGNGDQQQEQEQTAEDQQGEDDPQDEGTGDEEKQQQGSEQTSGEKDEGSSQRQAQAAQASEQMSEKEARALLNLLGNEQVLKMRMPGMANRPTPEKDW